MKTNTSQPWKRILELSEAGQQADLLAFLTDLPGGELALSLARLTDDQQRELLSSLPSEQAAKLLDRLPDVQTVELIEHLEPQVASAILDQLPSDEQADLLGDLSREVAAAILERMAPAEAADARALSQYADDVAGGLMVTEYLRFREDATVALVLQDMRTRAHEYRKYDVQYAYVYDDEGRLTGVLRLRDLLLAEATQSLPSLMIRNPISVRNDAPLDDLAEFFDRHHFLAVPVTDERGTLLGVVQESAVAEAWGDRQNTDFLKTQGITGGDEIRTMPILLRTSRRLSWLSVNILLNVIAASVIALFQDTLESVIALAVFLPIISDMSGCSGNQAVAVSLRELSLGLVRPGDLWRVWLGELTVGVLNGVVLGLLIALVAFLWKGNPYLGFVVGIALCLNTIVAVSIGGLVPLVLKRWKADPAIASGPILTTVTDMCGFFFVLGIATLLLKRLQ